MDRAVPHIGNKATALLRVRRRRRRLRVPGFCACIARRSTCLRIWSACTRGGRSVWIDEHKRWNERDLSTKRYIYVWADGIHLQARLEDNAQCILVIIGATPEGRKELVGFTDGTRESAPD